MKSFSTAVTSVTFEYSIENMIATSLRYYRSPSVRKLRRKEALGYGFAPLIFIKIVTTGFGEFQAIALGLLAYVIFVPCYPKAMRLYYSEKRIRTLIEKDLHQKYPGGMGSGGVFGEHTVTLFEEGFQYESSSDSSAHGWESITYIQISATHVLFFKNSEIYFEVPNSNLLAGSFDEFVSRLKKAAPQKLQVCESN